MQEEQEKSKIVSPLVSRGFRLSVETFHRFSAYCKDEPYGFQSATIRRVFDLALKGKLPVETIRGRMPASEGAIPVCFRVYQDQMDQIEAQAEKQGASINSYVNALLFTALSKRR